MRILSAALLAVVLLAQTACDVQTGVLKGA